jgi:hypothetical protein
VPRGLDDHLNRTIQADVRDADQGRRFVGPSRDWLTLHQPPHPSALLITTRVMAIVEGRRVAANGIALAEQEAFIILHSLDALFDDARGRFVAGLLVVEEDDTAPGAVEALRDEMAQVLTKRGLLARCLPHREPSERREIARGFLGVTSWQRVCGELGVPRSTLPESVLEVPQRETEWCTGQASGDAGDIHSVVVGRDLDSALEAHRQRMAKHASVRFPPVTLTDAARQALRSFYRSPAWRELRESASAGAFPVRRLVPTSNRWHFVLPNDEKIATAIEWHADLLDGTRDDAVDDALFRYYARGRKDGRS